MVSISIFGLRLRVRFRKSKIQKRNLKFLSEQISPVWDTGKWTEESLPKVDYSVPLMHYDPKDLGLLCLEKKNAESAFGFKNPILYDDAPLVYILKITRVT